MSVSGETAGLVLAGGRSRRMGGRDKALVELDGETLVARCVRRLAPQVAAVGVSVREETSVPGLAAELVPDGEAGGEGPLAGILAGLRWARARDCRRLASLPVDTPFAPADLVAQLAAVATADRIAVAASLGREHRTVALWPVAVETALTAYLRGGSDRSVRGFLAAAGFVAVDVAAGPDGTDPFFNVNTPDDLALARRLAAGDERA